MHEEFRRLYDLGLNDAAIARACGVGAHVVNRWRWRLGLVRRHAVSATGLKRKAELLAHWHQRTAAGHARRVALLTDRSLRDED